MLVTKKDNVNLIVNMGEYKDLQTKELTREPELYTNTLMFIQTRILNRKRGTKCLITL
jgi:hypothetical protein